MRGESAQSARGNLYEGIRGGGVGAERTPAFDVIVRVQVPAVGHDLPVPTGERCVFADGAAMRTEMARTDPTSLGTLAGVTA